MGEKVLYISGGDHKWVQIAEELKDSCDIFPEYWLGSSDEEGDVKEQFPNVKFHSHRRALRGLPSKDVHSAVGEQTAIDKDTLDRYRKYTYTIFRAMDRVDPKYSFNYDERVRYYHKLLRYWKDVFKEYGISLVIFPGSPPHGYSNLIDSICTEEGIRKIILQNTKIPNTWFIRSEIHEKPHFLAEDDITVEQYTLSETADQYYQNQIKTGDRHFTPSNRNYTSFLSNIVEYPSYLTKLFSRSGTYYKKPHKQMESEEVTWIEYLVHKYRMDIRKKRLKRHYESLSERPKLSEDYIFVPLHYQPERTTVPEGDVYSTQNLFVRLLHDVLPDDCQIFVKEHPVQFHTFKEGEHSRSSYHYDDLDSLNTVKLIELETDVNMLIDNSMAVATLTGTAAWEAAFRNTPSLMFGTAWYAGCPGVYDVKNKSDIADAIQEIKDDSNVERSDMKRYMKIMEKYGFQSYSTSGQFDRMISEENTVENTVAAISNYLGKTESR